MSDPIRDEYSAFLSEKPVAPPVRVSETILARVRKDLNPTATSVFSKLMGIHMLTALLTLSLCEQFGVRLAGDGVGLMRVFMAFGTYGCLVACGAFFTGVSLFVASLVLRIEEVRKIRNYWPLSLGALALLSLGFFIMLDAEIVFHLGAAWFLGAVAGSWLTLEVGWILRRKAWSA